MYYSVCPLNIWSGADQSADAPLLLHESAGHRDLAVCAGRVHAGLFHAVCDGALLPVRVEQSAPVPPGVGRCGEPILGVEQFLVHYRHILATGLRTEPKGCVAQYIHWMTLKPCVCTCGRMWTNVYLQLKALTTCTRRWSRMLVEDAFRWLDWFSGCVCFVGRDYYYYPSVLCWVLVRDEAEVALECMTINPVLSNRRVCFKRFSVLTLLLQHAG